MRERTLRVNRAGRMEKARRRGVKIGSVVCAGRICLGFLFGAFGFLLFANGVLAETADVEFYISENMTRQLAQRRVVAEQGSSVGSLLRREFPIASTYGGGFITQISGHPASPVYGCDWFYYVNGVMAPVGASAYKPNVGDHVWWDYHCWRKAGTIAAVVGAYPHPFLSARPPTLGTVRIEYSEGLEGVAKRLQVNFQAKQIASSTVVLFSTEQALALNEPLLIIAPSARLLLQSQLKDAHEQWRKSGFLVHFDEKGRIVPRDWEGELGEPRENGAVIQAMSWTEESHPLWLISGTDSVAIEKACQVLVDNPEKLRGKAAVLVNAEEVVGLPEAESQKAK